MASQRTLMGTTSIWWYIFNYNILCGKHFMLVPYLIAIWRSTTVVIIRQTHDWHRENCNIVKANFTKIYTRVCVFVRTMYCNEKIWRFSVESMYRILRMLLLQRWISSMLLFDNPAHVVCRCGKTVCAEMHVDIVHTNVCHFLL